MLITASLLNSFRWYSQFYGPEPEDEIIQREDFLRMLRREPMAAPNESILKGRQLEDDIVDYCKAGGYSGARRDIRDIGDNCMGGRWQVSIHRDMGGEFLFYGRVDNMRADTIRDVKYAKGYDIGKFVRSAQHRIYLWCCPTIPKFIYEVSDGWNAYQELYTNHAGIEGELRALVADFLGYLDGDIEAKEIFNNKWKAL